MASVTSLDQDMRSLRISRYTPAAAAEVRTWIEETLGEPLAPGDLMEALKDGIALCRLANLILPAPGVKFKSSAMPFIQMENISHFLRACEMAPLQLPAHDRFLTVDLFESKDPAQVLQCLGSFSRKAHAAQPSVFRTTIGPKSSTAGTASNGSRGWQPPGNTFVRPASPTKPNNATPSTTLGRSYTGSSTGSQAGRIDSNKPPTGPVSSWSKRSDESSTAPAWNIHQYGYMGGASQGNQGVSFGSRRQIVSNAPAVPSLAEKERLRKEKVLDEERQRLQAEEEERRRREQAEAEEEQARLEEERKWEEETRRLREEERQSLEAQKKKWEDDERRWKEEEESRRRDEVQSIPKPKPVPDKPSISSSGILRGQTLSQYQREQSAQAGATETPEQRRLRELEKQLEDARERERQYQVEREGRMRKGESGSKVEPAQADIRPQSAAQSDQSWAGDEREDLRRDSRNTRNLFAQRPTEITSRTRPAAAATPTLPSRPEPFEQTEEQAPSLPQRTQPSAPAQGTTSRPLPEPSEPPTIPSTNRTDRFLATTPAPLSSEPRISASHETGDTSLEQQRDRDARISTQQKTKAGGWASKSLLEREMERERERQREWEVDQERTKNAPRDASQGTGAGQAWDVNQYGFMGGDNMNRGSGAGSGINIGAGRRQILGPRDMSSPKKH